MVLGKAVRITSQLIVTPAWLGCSSGRHGYRCFVDCKCAGIRACADDTVLLASRRRGLWCSLSVSERAAIAF